MRRFRRLQGILALGIGLFVATVLRPSSALADAFTIYAPPTRPSRLDVPGRPTYANAAVATGLVLFGGPYIASVAVASSSSHPGDDKLYLPLVGPWADIGERGGCPVGVNCSGDAFNKLLLAADGVSQDVGAIAVLVGLMMPVQQDLPAYTGARKHPRDKPKASLHLSPQTYPGGAGFMASGTF